MKKSIHNKQTTHSKAATALLALFAVAMLQQPAYALDGILYTSQNLSLNAKFSSESVAIAIPDAEVEIATPSLPSIFPTVPTTPTVPVALPAAPVTIPTQQLMKTSMQATLNNTSRAIVPNMPSMQMTINFGDATPAAGGDEAALPANMVVATVDLGGDGLLSYSVSDMTVIESLAPAAGGTAMDKKQKKEIMDHVYDQVILMEGTEPTAQIN